MQGSAWAATARRGLLRANRNRRSAPRQCRVLETHACRLPWLWPSCCLLCGLLNSTANSLVSPAAADIAGHRLVNFVMRWVGILGQESDGLHDLSRLAVSALGNLLRDPGFLHRMAAIRG